MEKSDAEINEFVKWLQLYCSTVFWNLMSNGVAKLPVDIQREILTDMMHIGKGHWLNLQLISMGYCSLN